MPKWFNMAGPCKADIHYRYGQVVMGMELKIWRQDKPDSLARGLTQLDKYLEGLELTTGWLVIFDRRSNLLPMEEWLSTEKVVSPGGI